MKPDNQVRDSKIFLAVMSGTKAKDVAKDMGLSSSRISVILQKKGCQIRSKVYKDESFNFAMNKIMFGHYGCHKIKDYLKNGSKWIDLHHKYYPLEGEVS
jgi:hypothetical protein